MTTTRATPPSFLFPFLLPIQRSVSLNEFPAPESTWEVPPITAGTPEVRNFRELYHHVKYPWRTTLKVYNRSIATLTVLVNGLERRRVGPDNFVEIVMPQIFSYTIDASQSTGADQVEVFESGGLTEARGGGLDEDEEG
jgi:hypothetical protein